MKKCKFSENEILTYIEGAGSSQFIEHLPDCSHCNAEIENQKYMSLLLNDYYKKAADEAPAINIWALIEDELPEKKSIKDTIADFFTPLFAFPKLRYAAAGFGALAIVFFAYQLYTPPESTETARGVEINYIESSKAQVMMLDPGVDQNNTNTAVIWIMEDDSSNGRS